MTRVNAASERIKRRYFHYLREAVGRDEAILDIGTLGDDRAAAIDHDIGARHVGRPIRSQEQGHMRHLFRLAAPAERSQPVALGKHR